MGKRFAIIKNYINNTGKLCEFALNNICTAKCKFCSIWQQKEKHIVETTKALEAISHLAKLGITELFRANVFQSRSFPCILES